MGKNAVKGSLAINNFYVITGTNTKFGTFSVKGTLITLCPLGSCCDNMYSCD